MSYRVNIQTTPGDFHGNKPTIITEENLDSGKHVSEADWPEGGQYVTTETGRTKTVTDALDLADSNRVIVQGIPMTVKPARELGYARLIEKQVDASAEDFQRVAEGNNSKLNEAANKATAEEVEAANREAQVEAGLTTAQELHAGDSGFNTLAYQTGLNDSATSELLTDIITGEITTQDPVWQGLQERGMSQDATRKQIANAVKISEDAARRELGPDGYAELDRMAGESKTIRKLVAAHGLARSRGVAPYGWGTVLSMARHIRSQ